MPAGFRAFRMRITYLLAGAQLGLMGTVLFSGPLWPASSGLQILLLAGVGLGGWALLYSKHGKFNIVPEVAPGARLVTTGPFRWIRHPMYASVLLILGTLVINHFSLWRSLSWLALLLVLLKKIQCEEQFLLLCFPDYVSYRQRSWRLIPHVF
jgi:protein-S-isoprenylcysteine O-methyltransferase Ste14